MKQSEEPVFGLLAGYRVVMVGLSVAAPFAGELYAENGADVIWVENPSVVDSVRNSVHSGAWQQDRRNMRSLAMNYMRDEGYEAFLKLIERTDVLLEASVGGRYERIGLTDELLWEHNPRLVIVHISGFGQTGVPEYVNRASFDPIAQAFGCTMHMNGLPEQPSVPAMCFPADYTSAFYGFGVSCAALLKCAKTGKGESIDVAQFETMIRTQSNYPTDFLRYGVDYVKEGTHSRICAIYGTYGCGDGEEIYILFLGSGAVRRGLGIIGLEYGTDLFPDGSSLIPLGTPAADAAERAFAEFIGTRSAMEVEEIFASNGVPCSRVMTYADAVKNPHYQARKVFVDWMAVDGKTKVSGVKIVPELKNYPGQIWRGAPDIGMDNEDVLGEIGVPPEVIQRMYAEGKLSKHEYFEMGA